METVDSVIDELGGTFAVARLVGRAGPAVSQWKANGQIPPEHYFTLTEALEAAGKPAPPKRLFGFSERPASTQ